MRTAHIMECQRSTTCCNSLKESQHKLAFASASSNVFDDLENPNGIVDMPDLTLQDAPLSTTLPLSATTTATTSTSSSSSGYYGNWNDPMDALYGHDHSMFPSQDDYVLPQHHPTHVLNLQSSSTTSSCTTSSRRSDEKTATPLPPPPPPRSAVVREEVPFKTVLGDRWGNSCLRTQYHKDAGIQDKAFLLHNILSAGECSYIIDSALPSIRTVDKMFSHKYRNCDRALLHAPRLASELYQRLFPNLTKSDYVNRIPMCFGHDGVWLPFGLNDCIKVARYERGGLFAMHRDGPWIPREDQASIFTVVVYLNESFLGGITELYQSHGTAEEMLGPLGQRRSEAAPKTKVFPTTGTALVFNHDCWHLSTPVHDDTVAPKWILRTELIFQRVHCLHVDRCHFREDRAYHELRALYEASQIAMAEGRRAEFVELYQQVVQQQRDAMVKSQQSLLMDPSSSSSSTSPFVHPSLNADTLTSIFEYLSDQELVALRLVCRRAAMQLLTSDIWEFRTMHRFPTTCFSGRHPISSSSTSQQKQQQQELTAPVMDWYSVYVQQVLRTSATGARSFVPGAACVTPHGMVFMNLEWFAADGTLDPTLQRKTCNALFELLRTPSIRIIHPAIAVVAAFNDKKGDGIAARMACDDDEDTVLPYHQRHVVVVIPLKSERVTHGSMPLAAEQCNFSAERFSVALVDRVTMTVVRTMITPEGDQASQTAPTTEAEDATGPATKTAESTSSELQQSLRSMLFPRRKSEIDDSLEDFCMFYEI